MSATSISANLIDLFAKRIYPARIQWEDGKISSVVELDEKQENYILPGFIDAHIHIESSMLVPTAFARMAVVHGTVATVSDPHEIANVCGIQGIRFMIDNSKKTPFKFFFGASSCVPATFFETAGAVLNAAAIEALLKDDDIWYLAEMMNYPGVLNEDTEVMAKITAAHKIGKPVDGHAPGLKGDLAIRYASAGITTDHECFTLEEALDKVKAGMKILIREGSAAKNFEALIEIIGMHPDAVMFCSDDKHPDELVLFHINNHVKRAIAKGYDLFDVLRAACVHPVMHYRIPVGLLRDNDPADFIVIDNPENFNVLQTYIDGQLVAAHGKSLLPDVSVKPINNFKAAFVQAAAFTLPTNSPSPMIRVIEAVEGQLVTNELHVRGKVENGLLVGDIENDVLKMVIVNRYEENAAPAIAFIKNFGLKRGALASTVAHDCHNIIAVGSDDASIARAINALVASKGGIAVAEKDADVLCMPLPIAGLMTADDGYQVAEQYSRLDRKAKELGTTLGAPFMTLSFMALLVIPSLKLSDKGLFDGQAFEFTSIEI